MKQTVVYARVSDEHRPGDNDWVMQLYALWEFALRCRWHTGGSAKGKANVGRLNVDQKEATS